MKQKIIYQSSLPRAGSTLLQNILGQNPQILATPTSFMTDLVDGARLGHNSSMNDSSTSNDWDKPAKFLHSKEQLYAFIRGGLREWSKELTDRNYILDKNRSWGGKYTLLENVFNEKPKILYMVRDLRAVCASMEKKFRANPDKMTPEVDLRKMKGLTTFNRVGQWVQSHPVGFALQLLEQAILDGTASNFLFIKYEDMCINPKPIFKSIYEYLEIDYFEHDFDNIEQITHEDDRMYGIYGDHTIRNTLDKKPDDFRQILGENVNKKLFEDFNWFFKAFNYSY